MPFENTFNINPEQTKLVIFDVDGTLYNQSKLRKLILKSLLTHYVKRPAKIKELYILHRFRKLRENHAGYCGNHLNKEQYDWCASDTNTKIEKVKGIIEKWVYTEPLQYLSDCIYPGVKNLFDAMKAKNIKTAIFSDYPAHQKLESLGLAADLVVSATDSHINCFKPNPKGINYICETLSISKKNTVFIGDRFSRDAVCAMNATVPYFIIPENEKQVTIFFSNLIKQFGSI